MQRAVFYFKSTIIRTSTQGTNFCIHYYGCPSDRRDGELNIDLALYSKHLVISAFRLNFLDGGYFELAAAPAASFRKTGPDHAAGFTVDFCRWFSTFNHQP